MLEERCMAASIVMRGLAVGAFTILGCVALAQDNFHTGTIPLNLIVEALESSQATVHPQVSYRIVREYRLSGSKDSRADSEVVAEVNFRPPASKDYRIEHSSGSNRGQQVVKRVLEHEVASSSDTSSTALTRNNYDFSYVGVATWAGRPCYLLGLKPKRKEAELISGQVWIDAHSFIVRHIEGELAKTPSWWLRKVAVKLTFADVEGTWLQTGMEATADVRIVGRHTLTSRILDYRTANEVASARTSIQAVRKP
jgi:hypothetical protein